MGVLKLNVLEKHLKEKKENSRMKIHYGKMKKVSACGCPCSEFRKNGVITSDIAETAHWNID